MPNRTRALALTLLLTACSAHLPSGAPPAPTTPSQIASFDPAPLFLIDGQEIRAADLTMIDSESIETIDVLKGTTATSLYGPRAAAGVVQIASKASSHVPTPAASLFVLDGREVPAALVRVLDAKKIDTIEVLKGQAAALAYGSRARDGVVLIRSKAG